MDEELSLTKLTGAARLLLVLATALTVAPAAVTAQGQWDAPRALELAERARERRALPARDTLLRNYSARAEGFVYFYLDRRDSDERTLIKTDQIALELYWAAPNLTKQRIVGLRDASRFPNRMHYHLDHLTVVQNGFGDVIRMGDGDEVSDVPHPAAAGSDSIYHFRLADSLSLRLPGMTEPIRVYELNVRPRRNDRAALVGSIFVDRATGDIVRMTFTFTPVSYVDRRLDHITVSLDNGLWEGRYWLPNEQTLQIRRQIPELDFAASAVIQGRMRISDYEFNDSIPPSLFLGYPVTAVPHAEREAYEFERDIYDDLNEEGLATPADLSEVRRQAAELLGTSRLSGLPRWRLGLGTVSSALRYNRAEGLAAGGGIVYAPGPSARLDIAGGYAFGPDHVRAELTGRRATSSRGQVRMSVLVRDTRDLGLRPAVPSAVNTLSAAILGDDYLDAYYATGARLWFRQRVGSGLRVEVEIAGERHRSATLSERSSIFSDSALFRAVLPVDDGDLSLVSAALVRDMPDPRASAWAGAVRTELGTLAGGWYLRPTMEASLRRTSANQTRQLLLSTSAGALLGDAPSQRLFLLGGTGTLPGFEYRSFAGTRYALAGLEASTAVFAPWLRLRLIGAAGAAAGLAAVTPVLPPETAPAWHAWNVTGTNSVRVSAGGGIGLMWDLLRIDWVRGLNGGEWRLLFSLHRDFWDIS